MTLLFSEPLLRFQSKTRPDNSTLSIRVKRNEQFDEEYYERIDTSINWNCTAFNESSLDFQIYFSKPMNISFESQDAFDSLEVEVLERYFFLSEDASKSVPYNYNMTAPVPVQFASEDEEKIVLQLAAVVNSLALGILILLIIAQILGKSLIKRVWSLFCSLQIILLTESLKSAQPPNLTVFRTEIQNILELNAIPREDIEAWSVSHGVKFVQLTSGFWG